MFSVSTCDRNVDLLKTGRISAAKQINPQFFAQLFSWVMSGTTTQLSRKDLKQIIKLWYYSDYTEIVLEKENLEYKAKVRLGLANCWLHPEFQW